MFRSLGRWIDRWWAGILIVWITLLILVHWIAPEFQSVVKNGEFAFLPTDAQTVQAEALFRRAFPADSQATPAVDKSGNENGDAESDDSIGKDAQQLGNDPFGSNLVIVVRRTTSPTGLTDQDKAFVEETLRPEIEKLAGEATYTVHKSETGTGQDEDRKVIRGLVTSTDKRIGKLLTSDDNKATLVVIELATDFLDWRPYETIDKIKDLVNGKVVEVSRKKPAGLELALSGSAAVGRDMLEAEKTSAANTETYTKVLVIFLLIVIYQAPILALIPLITVWVSVESSMLILQILAGKGIVGLFQGINVYITVVVYGAGVDYCLFLIARYKEELDGGASYSEALQLAVERVGAALTASAGTVICGIGMLIFATFGKFKEAGVGISFGLCMVLLASLSFTPALLRLFGKWAFWPNIRRENVASASGWIRETSVFERVREIHWLKNGWDLVGKALLARPAMIFTVSTLLMLPFAVVAVLNFGNMSYGLLSDLPQKDMSVVGAKVVQEHFAAGAAGTTTVLIKNEQFNFVENGLPVMKELTASILERSAELSVDDVRSISQPLGREGEEGHLNPLQRKARNRQSQRVYYSTKGPEATHVARLDIVFRSDPFSRESIRFLDRFEETLKEILPAEIKANSTIHAIGSTASIRDLKRVTDSDQIRVDILVLVSVFLVLVLLLRRPALCGFLIVSVFFSYLVTLGATYAVFWLRAWMIGDPGGFGGLDWKVPMFLFTILIAVGEDYNIFLIARILEEQEVHGRVKGIIVALQRTGSIISSCGIIMAGTFASLMTGTLLGLIQLGFALTFGVLLDTFVIRPILVPAWILLLNTGRFGKWGRWLGAELDEPAPTEPANTPVRQLETSVT